MGKLLRLAVFLSAVSIGGCASMIDGPDQSIAIMSTPGEADFVISDDRGREVHRGVTPSIVNLAKSRGYFEGNNFSVEISKAGYTPEQVQIASDPSMIYLVGNIATFLVGWFVVDPLTGAMWELEPDMLNVALQSEQAVAPPLASPAPAAVAPAPAANYGALVASFENEEQAELGKTEIWSRHSQVLGAIEPSITYGSVADAEPRYLVIGGGLTNDQALNVCATLTQRNEPCTVIQFQS